MPVKQFFIANRVKKTISKLPKSIQLRALSSMDSLVENPLLGKRLHGELADLYKLRLGDYRLIYTFNPSISRLELIKIEHRQGVYK